MVGKYKLQLIFLQRIPWGQPLQFYNRKNHKEENSPCNIYTDKWKELLKNSWKHTLCLSHKTLIQNYEYVQTQIKQSFTCVLVIFPWVVQLPSVKLFMLTELSMCTHRKRVWGLINKSYYVISDKVVFTSVSSLETRNGHNWARSRFSVLLQQLTSARYLREIYMCTLMGDMGWLSLTAPLYISKPLTPKPFQVRKLHNPQWFVFCGDFFV